MHIQRRREEDEGLPLTPLIDVVFLLLIFFLTATSFHKKERDIKVNPPKASEAKAQARRREIVINVRSEADGGFIIVGDRMKSLQELTELLTEAAQDNPQQLVIIRGDRHAYHQRIVDVLNACRKAKITNYYIAATPSKAE